MRHRPAWIIFLAISFPVSFTFRFSFRSSSDIIRLCIQCRKYTSLLFEDFWGDVLHSPRAPIIDMVLSSCCSALKDQNWRSWGLQSGQEGCFAA
ncbi:uncharacterized protein J3R85_008287 [Psidium guajava]|nr:uncharacterized protein J3R85_008287 [Psidium guajava]